MGRAGNIGRLRRVGDRQAMPKAGTCRTAIKEDWQYAQKNICLFVQYSFEKVLTFSFTGGII